MTELKHTVFISHASNDRNLADHLASDLEARGISVWSDRSIKAGENWIEAIEEGLRESEYFILILSPAALKSEWVSFEAGVALSRDPASPHRRLLPVLTRGVERSSLPAALRRINAIEMEGTGIAQESRRVADLVAETVKADDQDEEAQQSDALDEE